jgi:hypothetical protein
MTVEPIDLNEEEHPWRFTYVGFYDDQEDGPIVTISGNFKAEELRYIADFMESGKAKYRPDPD